jgi:hypothetical protein
MATVLSASDVSTVDSFYSPSPNVGGILECGGKRSATPLCSHRDESLGVLCALEVHIDGGKSAVAVSLCRRSPIGLAITISSHLSDAFGENEFVR